MVNLQGLIQILLQINYDIIHYMLYIMHTIKSYFLKIGSIPNRDGETFKPAVCVFYKVLIFNHRYRMFIIRSKTKIRLGGKEEGGVENRS